MNVKVSIPVEVGGYTGQRDAWTAVTLDYNVEIEDDGRVVLEDSTTVGRKIWFDLEDLQKAIAFLQPPKPAGPVMRSSPFPQNFDLDGPQG